MAWKFHCTRPETAIQVPKERISSPRTDEILNPDYAGLTIVIGGDRRVIFYPCRNASILNV